MRSMCGYFGGLVFAVGVFLSGSMSVAADGLPFVRFADPQHVVNQPSDSVIALASCCEAPSCNQSTCGATSSSCDACDRGCDSGCGLAGCGFAQDLLDHLAGLPAPSEQCYNCFISPMTNPLHFEDPRTLTEARFIYLHHKVPLTALGGDVDLFAVQLRAALSERLSLIATKDGYVTSSNPLIDDGWADINVGLKYNLLRDPSRQFLYTVGATYEMPVGSTRTLQGNGDGTFHLFSTVAHRIHAWNCLYAHGVIIPLDGDAESDWFYVSTHFSRKLGSSDFYFLSEFNWYNWLESGSNGIPGVEGLDIFNFGSTGVTGNDIVTGAFGLKYKPRSNVEMGVAWENPLTKRRDILENRLTFDLILRY